MHTSQADLKHHVQVQAFCKLSGYVVPMPSSDGLALSTFVQAKPIECTAWKSFEPRLTKVQVQ